MFDLTTHSTHFIYGYMASDMVKDHSDSEKANPLPPHRLLLSINRPEDVRSGYSSDTGFGRYWVRITAPAPTQSWVF